MDRWKNWKRLKPLCLILALALVVCPATRAFAASTTITYSSSISDKIGYPWQLENSMLESGFFQDGSKRDFASGILEVSQIIEFRISTTTSASAPDYPYQLQFTSGGHITWNNPLVGQYPNVTFQSARAEAIYDEYDQLEQDVNLVLYNVQRNGSVAPGSSTAGCDYAFRVSGNNAYLSQDYLLKVKVTNTYFVGYGNSTQLIALNLNQLWINNANSVTVTNSWRRGTVTPLSDFDPNAANLDSINNAIVNESAAGAALDQANQDFVQDAAQLESHQSVLENAADASVAAVDMNQVNLIDTYSQSVSFWGQLIGELPAILGSLWYVFIFGLLIAFVLFVLRIRR